MATVFSRSFIARFATVLANLLGWLMVGASLAGVLYAISLLPWPVLAAAALLPVLPLRRAYRSSAEDSRRERRS